MHRKWKCVMIPPGSRDSGWSLFASANLHLLFKVNPRRINWFTAGFDLKMFYLREKLEEKQSDKCCDFHCREWWRETATPMGGGPIPQHAHVRTPWRTCFFTVVLEEILALLILYFRPFCAPLQHITSSFLFRCEKITSWHLWHFIKQNCFLLLCLLCFSQTSWEPLDPEHK